MVVGIYEHLKGQVVMFVSINQGFHNLHPPLVETGLTNLPKLGGGGAWAPLTPTALRHGWNLCSVLGSCSVVCLAAVACDVA